jgi:hypothetical protein
VSRKAYIGDSVYAAFDPQNAIVLTTENGGPPSNTIILEPDVWSNLKRFVEPETEEQG